MEPKGKIVVITGATSGIGQATAVDFARRGARVFVVGRDAVRAQETQALAAAAGASLEVVLGDVSTAAGVRALADELLRRTDRIDVLLNNAGGQQKALALNAEGVEQTYALNTLGAFRLEEALHGALVAARGRVVNVATGFLDSFPVDVDDLARPKKFKGLAQYGRAKLASVMMTVEQARRFTGVTAVSVHPGIVMGTRFGGGQPRAMQLIVGPILRALGLACSMDEAVRRFAVACFDGVPNGAYVVKGAPAPLPRQAHDDRVRSRIWSLLVESRTPALA